MIVNEVFNKKDKKKIIMNRSFLHIFMNKSMNHKYVKLYKLYDKK